MELELQKDHFACYRVFSEVCQTHEESTEIAVPEHCMDLSRIVDAGACLLLRSHELTDGRLSVTGSIRVSVLYMAEEAPGLRSFETTLPFEQDFDTRLDPLSCDVALRGSICTCEARLLNPRKLSLRVAAELCAVPYCRAVLTTCPQVPDGWGIEAQSTKSDVSLLCAIREKDFLFADEITLHGSRPPIAELLCYHARLRVTECKAVGSKIILKGLAVVDLLYRDENDEVSHLSSELPFSQVIEGLEEGDDTGAAAVLHLTGCEIRADGDDGRSVSVKLFIHAFVTLRRRESVCCIADLYSTTHDLTVETESVELPQEPETFSRSQTLREQLDTGVEVKSVLCTEVCFTGISLAQRRANVQLRMLYLDENGTTLLSERRIELPLDLDADSEARVSLADVIVGDAVTSINAGGVEVRVPIEFVYTAAPVLKCSCLSALRAEPRQEEDAPALVLRTLAPEASLWALAKRYRTTVGEILAANELESEAAVLPGRMLLIPRKRST